MNAADTKFRSRSRAAREKPITVRRRASLVIALLGNTTVGASGAVGEFAVHDGDLTELAGSLVSLPAGATPAGIIANEPVPATGPQRTGY